MSFIPHFKWSPFKQAHDLGYYSYRLLQIVFSVLPILAGLDKFFELLTRWSSYLSPFAQRLLNNPGKGFMMGIGLLEIAVGIGVIFKPRLFSYLIAFWLLATTTNLILTGQYLDLALRDAGLFVAAVGFALLSQKYSQ